MSNERQKMSLRISRLHWERIRRGLTTDERREWIDRSLAEIFDDHERRLAERDRYREALEKVATYVDVESWDKSEVMCKWCREPTRLDHRPECPTRIAREALER